MSHKYWLCYDIIGKINEFISDYITLYNLHRICKMLFYYRFKNIQINQIKRLPNIGTITRANFIDQSRLAYKLLRNLSSLVYLDVDNNITLHDNDIVLLTHLKHLKCDNNTNFTDI